MPSGVGRYALPRWLAALVLCAFAALTPGEEAPPERTLLVMGDSLAAAYGMDVRQGWVALLAQRLEARPQPYRVVNASISGETTRGGRTRLSAALREYTPALVIVELGGNDGLRGVSLEETRRNLDAMVAESLAAGARVLLVGIELPPNYGPVYTGSFRAMFAEVAARHQVPLLPFLLEGVALDSGLMQADGIHPAQAAQPILLENVWTYLEPLLE